MNPHDELTALLQLFPQTEPLVESAEHVPAALVPDAFKRLLAHDHHMTVTMEEFFHCEVSVRVLEAKEQEGLYCRMILLESNETGQVVQFGIVRFNFEYVTEAVKEEILSRKIPLGRVLINHNVLRHIDLGAVLKIKVGPKMAEYFDVPVGMKTYGRLATIFCNGQPAVDLLEIATPLAQDVG
ncbi:hypothetical protein Pla110_31710 [Polystyrenella longa]|uniref:Uncharacterized protein n=1 Tax=Polystyrenella longa TaxID=2528007 RepID=A0A518CQF0_9PLAN|nr:hypothetical protein [Polystyrenella longa]QDU81430.1 hypothetical protein Pla110_31710 [Polystyrenella longa]